MSFRTLIVRFAGLASLTGALFLGTACSSDPADDGAGGEGGAGGEDTGSGGAGGRLFDGVPQPKTEGEGTIVGTVGDETLTVANALSQFAGSPISGEWLRLDLTNQKGLCDTREEKYVVPGEVSLIAELYYADGNGPYQWPTKPDTFQIGAWTGAVAHVWLFRVGGGCMQSDVVMNAGSVTIEKLNEDGTVAGKGQGVLNSGEQISFTFDTGNCDSLGKSIYSTNWYLPCE